MFAPKAAKIQAKTAAGSANCLAHQSSTVQPRQFNRADPARLPRRAIGNQATLRLQARSITPHGGEADTGHLSAGEFAEFPPGQALGVAESSPPRLAPPPGMVQAKLAVGPVDDPLEREADHAADQVMRTPAQPVSLAAAPGQISRKCAKCEEEEKSQRQSSDTRNGPLVQRKSSHIAAPVSPAVANHLGSTGGGVPLPAATRHFMERRFGTEFSAVRIHAGPEDANQSRSLNAHAFTIGDHIHFGDGKFQPGSFQGLHLLAHELAHTIQQRGGARLIQRDAAPAPGAGAAGAAPDKAAEATALETKILGTPEYAKLNAEAKGRANWIIAQAMTKPLGDQTGQRNYYLNKLLTALTTPFNGTSTGTGYGCSAKAETDNRKVVDEALDAEKMWMGAYSDVDEKAVATGTHFVPRYGEQGKIYYVDRSDPKNIRVKMKVKLNGKPEEVQKVKALEDAIERSISMSTKGYFVDIEFVDKSAFDVFEFSVIFCEWPNSGNWASSPVALSHESHHALGLPDRYDYIESHADNDQMNVEMRLVWFAEQMKKTSGPRDAYSKMSDENNPLLAEDVCAVAYPAGYQRNKCIEARKSLDPAGIPPVATP